MVIRCPKKSLSLTFSLTHSHSHADIYRHTHSLTHSLCLTHSVSLSYTIHSLSCAFLSLCFSLCHSLSLSPFSLSQMLLFLLSLPCSCTVTSDVTLFFGAFFKLYSTSSTVNKQKKVHRGCLSEQDSYLLLFFSLQNLSLPLSLSLSLQFFPLHISRFPSCRLMYHYHRPGVANDSLSRDWSRVNQAGIKPNTTLSHTMC